MMILYNLRKLQFKTICIINSTLYIELNYINVNYKDYVQSYMSYYR